MPHEAPEVLILGAGIAGCALAYHLARRAIGPVVVHDPRTPAAGASGRAAGIVTEQLWNEWDVAVTRESHREYGQLAQRWEPEAFRANGFVRWTRRPEVAQALGEALDRWRSWGVGAEEATVSDLERWIPTGRFGDVLSAVVSRSDAVVTPSSITDDLRRRRPAGGRDLRFRPGGAEPPEGRRPVRPRPGQRAAPRPAPRRRGRGLVEGGPRGPRSPAPARCRTGRRRPSFDHRRRRGGVPLRPRPRFGRISPAGVERTDPGRGRHRARRGRPRAVPSPRAMPRSSSTSR